MKLNRKIQADILHALEEVYPDSMLVQALPHYSDNREFMANLFYLQEHQLIEGGDIREPGQCRSMIDAQITKTGLDFLADDGGILAILGGPAVKFFYAELIELVENMLQNYSIPEKDLSSISSTMGAMTEKQLKALVTQLFTAKDEERPAEILNFIKINKQ